MHNDALSPTPVAPIAPAGRAITPYVAVWTALAVVALAYISVAIARPDLLGKTGTTAPSVAENNAATDASALEAKLARMERELAATQAENAKQMEEKKTHLERIAALEAKTAEANGESQANQAAANQEAEKTAGTVPFPTSKQAADEIADRLGGAKILNGSEADTNTTTIAKQAAKTATEKSVEAVTKEAIDKTEATKTAAAEEAAKATAAAKKVEEEAKKSR